MVNINIKKYSRSNVETSSDPIIEDKSIKKKRKTKKKFKFNSRNTNTR
jgi:hypothetical protein